MRLTYEDIFASHPMPVKREHKGPQTGKRKRLGNRGPGARYSDIDHGSKFVKMEMDLGPGNRHTKPHGGV